MVKILADYPEAVVAQAVDPALGIAGKIEFLNLAKIKKLMDDWRDEYFESLDRHERANRRQIAAPVFEHPTPEAEKRIAAEFDKLVAHLKSGFSPSTQ